MLEKIQSRIAELNKSIEQLVANHNYLTGALQEANNLLELFIKHREEIESIASKVDSSPIEAVIEGINLAASMLEGASDDGEIKNPE